MRAWLTGVVIVTMVSTSDARADAEPKMIAAWAAGPFEARLAFDKAVGPGVAKALVGRAIAFQGTGPDGDSRGTVRVAAARLDDSDATIVLTIDPHPRAGKYSLTAPGVVAEYTLGGVEAVWDDGTEGAAPSRTGWLPNFDPGAIPPPVQNAPAFAKGSGLLKKPGRLTLTSLVALPEGPVRLRLIANAPIVATLDGLEAEPVEGKGPEAAIFSVESTGAPMLLSVALTTGQAEGPLSLRVSVQEGEGAESPLPPTATLLPWAPAAPPTPAPLANVPDLAGGDPNAGAKVFASEAAKCANCHKFRDKGGEVGPDLTNLVGRDPVEVYRDIAEPSARIHPDYVPYTLALTDGRILVGTVRAEGADALRVSDTEAKTTTVSRADVEDVRPSATSVMPVGLAGAIGEAALRDLIAYLTRPATPE